LPLDTNLELDPALWPSDGDENEPVGEPKWHALWTRSHCEQLVHDQLAAKKFDLFLPKINVWSRRAGLRCLTQVPLFPGYLFVRRAMDKRSYTEICKARGLVRILGERWDRLAVIPEGEIMGVQKVLSSEHQAVPHSFVREGQRVRITRGPLKDVEGILLRNKPDKGLFVVSIDLLQRSVAVEIDCTQVVTA
jgi:transcription termination/antitermination protein NusG